jgi:hypothetical protein
MLESLKEKVKTAASATTSLVDGVAERQVGFATKSLSGSLATARQLRESRSLNDVLALQTSYLTDLQAQLVALGSANATALKEFGATTVDLFKKAAKEAKPAAKKSAG